MKTLKKRNFMLTVVVTLILAIVVSVFISAQGAIDNNSVVDGNFNVTINGHPVSFNDHYGHPKLTKNTNRTMVPLRFITESMGYAVGWDTQTKTATITGGDSTVGITIGQTTALVNGKRVPIDVSNGKPVDTKAMLISVKGDKNPRTYVPLRFISEATGATISYQNINKVHHITITTDGSQSIMPQPQPEPQPEPGPGPGAGYVGNVKFNPATDVMEDGRLTHEKTRDFLDEMMRNVKVTKEGGSYFLEWKEVPLPAGQEYGFAFSTHLNDVSSGLGHNLSTHVEDYDIGVEKLPKKNFKYRLDNYKMSNVRYYNIQLAIVNLNKTGLGRNYSSKYSISYNPNAKTAKIRPYDATGGIMEAENFDKSIIFGPGL